MRAVSFAVVLLTLTGCMCRSGVIDCTTGRATPGFCKPLCGGPCDPFVWACGDCSTCCCCTLECGYTPYGGQMPCGDDMVYSQSCEAPPLRWAAPAVPGTPVGHVVHLPPTPHRAGAVTSPPAPPAPARKRSSDSDRPPTAPPADLSPLPQAPPPPGEDAPSPDDAAATAEPPTASRFPADDADSRRLLDARNDRFEPPRR